MESELRALLSGVDDSVIGTLAKNDIRSLEDAKLLSVEDLKELGFSIGTRNRLLKLFSEAKSGYVRTAATSLASGIGASVKNLLLSGRGAGAASDLAKFKQVFNIGGQDATDKARRDRLYPCWDTNANGFLSLHEVDQGIKTTLIGELKNKPEAERIWRRFRRSYIRAFVDAADAAPQRSRAATTRTGAGGNRRAVSDDDYVTRREFRVSVSSIGRGRVAPREPNQGNQPRSAQISWPPLACGGGAAHETHTSEALPLPNAALPGAARWLWHAKDA